MLCGCHKHYLHKTTYIFKSILSWQQLKFECILKLYIFPPLFCFWCRNLYLSILCIPEEIFIVIFWLLHTIFMWLIHHQGYITMYYLYQWDLIFYTHMLTCYQLAPFCFSLQCPFNISCKASVVVINPFSFYLSGKLISPFIVNESFVGYSG